MEGRADRSHPPSPNKDNRHTDPIDALPVAYLELDREWRFVRLNPACLRLMQKSIRDLDGEDIRKVFPDIHFTVFEEIGARVFETGETIGFTEFYEGAQVWVRGHAFPTADGIGLYFEDVTDQLLRERRIDDLARIVESCADAIVSTSLDGVVRSWNASSEDLFGYTAQEALGKPLVTLVAEPESVPELERIRAAVLAGKHVVPLRARARRKDGSSVDVEATISAVRDVGGTIVGASAVVRDVTELRRLERQQRDLLERERRAARELRALNEFKDSMMQALSHDLREPIASIIGFAYTLDQTGAVTGEEDQEMLQRISAAGRKLRNLVDDMLDLDRLQSGRLEVERSPIDLRRLAGLIAEDASWDGRAIEVAAESVVIDTDQALLRRVLDNLIGNAKKYSSPASTIHLTVRTHPKGAVITVEDEGAGVPDHLKAAIFEPFTRGDVSATEIPGIGLGLTVVARFTRLLGGLVWVEDREGGGSSFCLLLPRTRDAA